MRFPVVKVLSLVSRLPLPAPLCARFSVRGAPRRHHLPHSFRGHRPMGRRLPHHHSWLCHHALSYRSGRVGACVGGSFYFIIFLCAALFKWRFHACTSLEASFRDTQCNICRRSCCLGPSVPVVRFQISQTTGLVSTNFISISYAMYRLFRHTFGDQAFNDVWMNGVDESFTGVVPMGEGLEVRARRRCIPYR